MQSSAWIDLIRRVPARLHNAISFITVNGEIMAQDILRFDDTFILLRGRMAGTQDAGRIIVLPFDQIVNLALNKPLKAKEVDEIFGATLPAAVQQPAPATETEATEETSAELEETPEPLTEEEAETAEEPASEAAPVALSTAARLAAVKGPAKPEGPAAVKPGPISKTLLLERLRQRLAEHANQSGPASTSN